jgi:CheY-like chemotaxis protein
LNEKNKTTILVADDEEQIRDIVRHHLEKEGYTVITSKNGEEAIDVLNEYDISLTITDLKMPRVDGFGVVEFVKKHCNFVPIIILTGYVDVEIAVSAMKKGCFDYITKPIKKDELLEVVQDALSIMRAERARREFKIVEIYLLRDDGTVIFHEKMTLRSEMGTEIFGFMLTVIKTLVKYSIKSEDGLRGLESTDFKVLIEEGEGYFLTVIGQGSDLKPIHETMRETVEVINHRYSNAINSYDGNPEIFKGIGSVFVHLKNIARKVDCSN